MEAQGPIAGCLALVTASNRIDFFSLQDRKVVASTAGKQGASYYSGAAALFEYDANSRTLTRISVPDGRRERSITLPSNVAVSALSFGTERDSPIALATNVTQSQTSTQIGDLTITAKHFGGKLVILNSSTLQAAGWAQPVSLARMLGQPETGDVFANGFQADRKPFALPASHNGRIVTFPGFFLVLAPSYAVAYPFQGHDTDLLLTSHEVPLGGSITGLMAFSRSKTIKGGFAVGDTDFFDSMGLTPCGRYHLRKIPVKTPMGEECLEVRLAENETPLMLAGRLPFLTQGGSEHEGERRFLPIADGGALAMFHTLGRTMEIVDLNIPLVMKALAPDEFHVVSQPLPCLLEGSTMKYQVEVNNPSAVKSYRLKTAIPGASISPQGLFQYSAPTRITGPTVTRISLEIEDKNGRIALHEFPLYVLPIQRTSPQRMGPI